LQQEDDANQIGFDFEKYKNISFDDLKTEDSKNRRKNQDDIDSEFLEEILD
jgi:hypothetical protein